MESTSPLLLYKCMFPKLICRFQFSTLFILNSLVTHCPQPSAGNSQSNPSMHTTSKTVERLKSDSIFLPSSKQPNSKEPPLGITSPVKLRTARPEVVGGSGGAGHPFIWEFQYIRFVIINVIFELRLKVNLIELCNTTKEVLM